jgi:hypothetical protein
VARPKDAAPAGALRYATGVPDTEVVLRLFLPEVSPPALSRLRASLPGILLTPLGFEIPLGDRAPEEILSLFLRYGVTARATRIAVRAPSG